LSNSKKVSKLYCDKLSLPFTSSLHNTFFIMKSYFYSFLILSFLFTSSCEKVGDPRSVRNLTENLVIDLIRILFLEQYGGIQLERLETTDELIKTQTDCNQNKVIKINKQDDNFNWKGDLEFRQNCDQNTISNSRFPYENKFHYKDLSYDVAKLNWNIKGSSNSEIQYSKSSDKSKILYFQNTLRNNFNVSNKRLGIEAIGNMQVISTRCDYDLESKKISKEIIYTVRFKLTDKSSEFNNSNTYNGEITLNYLNEWIYMSDHTAITYKL
jgi:hypothetical protein